MAGGHVGALIHLSEFVTIGGAPLGALLVMSPKKVLVDLIRAVLQLLKGTPYSKQTYSELFQLLYALARMVLRDGILSLDAHVSNPHESTLFKEYPRIAGRARRKWRGSSRKTGPKHPVGQTFLSALGSGRQECLPHQ